MKKKLLIIFIILVILFLPIIPNKIYTCPTGPQYGCALSGTLVEVTSSNNPGLFYMSKMPIIIVLNFLIFDRIQS